VRREEKVIEEEKERDSEEVRNIKNHKKCGSNLFYISDCDSPQWMIDSGAAWR
jgi:hypothetical protein